MSFELYVAGRYLRAKRREKFISLVTVLAVLGVTMGVMALIIGMAINNGVEQDLQEHLLGATSHVNLLEEDRGFGIENAPEFMDRFRNVEHVVAMAPALYGEAMISGPIRGTGAVFKGIDPKSELEVADLLTKVTEGSLDDLAAPPEGYPGIALGKDLSLTIGAPLNAIVRVVNPQGEMTPFGLVPNWKRFPVAAIFESGFYEYDKRWVFTTLESAQQTLGLGNVINAVEFKLDDLNRADEVAKKIEEIAGPGYKATSWTEQNQALFLALRMEKVVTTVTIGLIMLVAALNILTSLVMIVMEKSKDIAILQSMGAKRGQIRKIFVWQGLLIGSTGTVIGLIGGHLLCWVCDTYQLIPLEAEVYGLSYVPFAPRLWDGLAVAAAAMVVSYLTTIYPSSSAARIVPVELLRYE
jgi:lipoprotein-releasing system permease protein